MTVLSQLVQLTHVGGMDPDHERRVMGETVYDPFAGSGSTMIAAALEGQSAIGCEFEERYCEAAAKRFEAELPPSTSLRTGGAGTRAPEN